MLELQTMIMLIESKYDPDERNTPILMCQCIKTEFDKDISENDILNFYNIGEDYEKLSKQVEYGRNI